MNPFQTYISNYFTCSIQTVLFYQNILGENSHRWLENYHLFVAGLFASILQVFTIMRVLFE